MRSYLKLTAFLLIFMFISCSKKRAKFTCSHGIEYLPPSISFVGFSETEIKNMSITQYKANTGLSEVISIDTLSNVNPVFKGDTAYAKVENNYPYGFLQIKEGVDYKVRLTTNGQEFVITNIESGPDSYTWTQEDMCSPGAGQTRFYSLSYKLNGEAQRPASPIANNFFIFLKP